MCKSYYYLSYSKASIENGLRIIIFPIADDDLASWHYFDDYARRDSAYYFQKKSADSIEFVHRLMLNHGARLFMVNLNQAKIICRNACLLET